MAFLFLYQYFFCQADLDKNLKIRKSVGLRLTKTFHKKDEVYEKKKTACLLLVV